LIEKVVESLSHPICGTALSSKKRIPLPYSSAFIISIPKRHGSDK
jgi:hypothetical protein